MTSAPKTVLVAEDEPLVRMLAVDVLTEAGYVVIEACHAGEAWAVLQECGGSVALLFTDVHMPGGVTGLVLVHQVHRAWPAIGLVLTSGLDHVSPHELPEGGRFIRKPYRMPQMLDHVQALAPH